VSTAQIDHLVVAADTLAQGATWCEQALGVTPGPGGKHTFMGTHNRLLPIGSPAFPQAYLEIIAIDPDAVPPQRPRWFGLDRPALHEAVRVRPRLLQVVARTSRIDPLRAALAALGQDIGPILAAERATPSGLLRWRISVRDDGQLLCGGALPTLIEWGDVHPADGMTPSAVSLQSVTLGGLPPAVSRALDLGAIRVDLQGPALRVTLNTPRGTLQLSSAD
jgi:hypothetical protein